MQAEQGSAATVTQRTVSTCRELVLQVQTLRRHGHVAIILCKCGSLCTAPAGARQGRQIATVRMHGPATLLCSFSAAWSVQPQLNTAAGMLAACCASKIASNLHGDCEGGGILHPRGYTGRLVLKQTVISCKVARRDRKSWHRSVT